jgi:hypothetical protein
MVNTEKHEAVMQPIIARRRTMNLPVIIDDASWEKGKVAQLE